MSIEQFLKNATKRKSKSQEISETSIEDAFVQYAKSCGCKAVKLIILNKRGFPDRTVLCPGGRVFFIEFKREGKKPTPVQISVRRWLVDLGFNYHVCDKKGQAEKILNYFLKN